ncbi:MAG: hypothetical protein AB9846_00180 [Tenuifilaceae bacterium]
MIEKLKETVETKFGKKINYQKDCKLLSYCVLEVTKEYISPATLRRIFGFLLTNSNPSRVTLDILSRYAGFNNWENFIENNKQSNNKHIVIEEIWARAQDKSKSFSTNTVDQIKRKSGINFNQTIHRQFADELFDNFIKSRFNATAVIGPGGYGKSTLLANWYEKNSHKKKFSKDIILFQQALALDSLANSDLYFEDWLMRLLGISPDSNFLDNILQGNSSAPGKFIIIIDALDESTAQGAKLEKIFLSLANLVVKYSNTCWFKIIISARFYTWNKFKTFINKEECWFNINPESFTHEGANMPLLSYEETQSILDNTINLKFNERKILEEFNFDLRETLSYPYFLQLFINVYHPETEYLLHDQLEIFREFIKKQVYQSQFSEEKIDILNKIIELTDFGLKPNDVRKNSLKEIYPIHLKLAGNYFAAYEDLVSFGLIIEDEVESKFGGITRIIKISNQILYEILLAQNLLEKEGGITFELFSKIEKQYAGSEILPSLIVRIFQFAYKDRIVEPLKNFFNLKEETLEGVLAKPTIAITLRRDEFMKKILIPIYTKIPIARIYFFETFPDLNNLLGSFTFFLKHYPLNTKNLTDKIYIQILNTYAGFLSMDSGSVERNIKLINSYCPSIEDNPEMVGRWFACMCLHNKLVINSDPLKLIANAFEHLEKLKEINPESAEKFENAFYPALIIINHFHIIEKQISAENNCISEMQHVSKGESIIYYYLCKLSHGRQIDSNDILHIERSLSLINPTNSYFQRILGLVLKSSFYLNNNDIAKANDSFRNAIEISNLAGYKLIEVKLLKNLSVALLNLGEKTKSIECNKFAESLAEKTGFNFDLL